MAIRLQFLRDVASYLSTFVGLSGELIVDQTNNRILVQDGTTPGGFATAKLAEVLTNTRTEVSDASYTVATTDRMVAIKALTAARTMTLCSAASYPKGTQLLFVDEVGAAATYNITIAAAGSDLINGVATAKITANYGFLELESNGASRWTIVGR